MIYDVAIIGKGPAGLSALLNAKIRNKSVIIFGKEPEGLTKTKSIKNYLGIEDIKGKDLYDSFYEQVKDYDFEESQAKINQVYAMGDSFSIMLSDETIIEAKTCILAIGKHIKKDIKNEDVFFAKGISYCATCDAGFYKGKKVVIVGYNEESIEDANYTSEIAGETIFLNMYKKDVKLNDSIKIIEGVKPLEFKGHDNAESLLLSNGEEIFADGFFVIKDSYVADRLVPSLEVSETAVIVDHNMQTNINGLYACGDITDYPFQVMKAVGQGQTAALNAVRYLDTMVE